MSDPLEPFRLAVPGFVIVRELGHGGMGVVFHATDRKLGRQVAIKFLRDSLADDVERSRFAREARLFSRLAHPHLVRMYDADLEAMLPYLVMELVEGRDLRRAMQAGDPPEPLELGRSLASALAYIHNENILHRDLKPHNVLLDGKRALLTDFGLARELSPDATALTAAGAVLGTPAYMPPEVVHGGRHTEAADVYALALMVHQVAAGPGIEMSDDAAVIGFRNRIAGHVPRLADLGRTVPPGLDDLLQSALAPDPTRRPTAAQLESELAALAKRRGPRASSGRTSAANRSGARSGGTPAAGTSGKPDSSGKIDTSGARSAPGLAPRSATTVAALAAITVAGIIALVILSRGHAPIQSPPPTTGSAPPSAHETLDPVQAAARTAQLERSREIVRRIWKQERSREHLTYATRTDAVFGPGEGVSKPLAKLIADERTDFAEMEALVRSWDRVAPETRGLTLEVLAARTHARLVLFLLWTSVQRVEVVKSMALGRMKANDSAIPGVDGISQLKQGAYPAHGAVLLERYYTDVRAVLDHMAATPGGEGAELPELVRGLWYASQAFRAVWSDPSWTGPYCRAFDRMRTGLGRVPIKFQAELDRVLDDFWFGAWTGCSARRPPTAEALRLHLEQLSAAVPAQRAALDLLAADLIAKIRR